MEKKKEEKNSLTGCIPISRIFSVRCTYTRVQRLSLMGWVFWTCCYKLIFLARNEFSLSTSLDYSRSCIWIWKPYSSIRVTRSTYGDQCEKNTFHTAFSSWFIYEYFSYPVTKFCYLSFLLSWIIVQGTS